MMEATRWNIRNALVVLVVIRVLFDVVFFISGFFSGNKDAEKCAKILEPYSDQRGLERYGSTFPTRGGLHAARCWCLYSPDGPSLDEHFTLNALAGFSSINNTVWFLDATTALTVMLLVDRRWLSGNILIVMIVFSTIFYDPLTALALFGIFVLTDEPPNPRAN